MEMLTLTMAGQQGLAGAARLRAGSGSPFATASCAVPAYVANRHLTSTSWNVDAIAEPTTATTVFDGKHRRTRQPSERSP